MFGDKYLRLAEMENLRGEFAANTCTALDGFEAPVDF
jgi:hypothetical protein